MIVSRQPPSPKQTPQRLAITLHGASADKAVASKWTVRLTLRPSSLEAGVVRCGAGARLGAIRLQSSGISAPPNKARQRAITPPTCPST